MEEPKPLPLKLFNPQVMLENINHLRSMIQRIRQKEGGIGSVEDQLSLYDAIQDMDLLVDIVDGLKAAYDDLRGKFDTVSTAALTMQKQNESLKGTYERMIQDRNDRIKELETKLGIRPEQVDPDPDVDVRIVDPAPDTE